MHFIFILRYFKKNKKTSYILVRTPPKSGPMMPMSRMPTGKNRAILCLRSVARARRAAGRWNTNEETTAHRNTPYHISGEERHHTVA